MHIKKTRNEYGIRLDSNEYAPSLFTHESFKCFRCHRYKETARHEIYGGPLRSKSKQYGLWINICPECHDDIHNSGELQDFYHRLGQRMAMVYYHWTVEDFRRRFYKNYLDIKEE